MCDVSSDATANRYWRAVMRGFENLPVDWSPASVWYDDDGNRQQTVEFIVPGRPVQKGNIIKNQWGAYHDATKGLTEWLAMVSSQAQAAMSGNYRRRPKTNEAFLMRLGIADHSAPLQIFTGAVMVDVTFVMPRLKKHGKKDPPPPHTGYPDSDKLFRSIGDAMIGIVFIDDKQIVEHHARKRYAYLDETPGAIILVTSNVRVQ